MTDQLNQLMTKVQGADIANEMSAHSLEKQASQMNDQINKYIEAGADLRPSIDPLETPDGYVPTRAAAATYPASDVDIVTIPNSMTIEDEHGNNLDAVKAGPMKNFAARPMKNYGKPTPSSFRNYKASSTKPMVLGKKFPTHSLVINNPSSNLLHRITIKPTTSLTLKLLKALKSSSTFRKNAQNLLASPTDTEVEVVEKEKRLNAFLKAYEMATDANPAIQSKVTAATMDKKDKNDASKDETLDIARSEPLIQRHDLKLLKVIKKLIGNDDSGKEKGQLQDLLSTLKSPEKEVEKLESEPSTKAEQPSKPVETATSSSYLKHFKEFIEKHKQDTPRQQLLAGIEENDHPLGKNVYTFTFVITKNTPQYM